MTTGRKALFAAVTIVLVAGFLELALALAGAVSPKVDRLLQRPGRAGVRATVPDDALGYRPNPDHPEHDENGYRNADVPLEVDVVTFGDSQTYGVGVRRDEAWPKVLERLTQTTAYSVAYGGWGPAHSLYLWHEAESLDPDVVVEALYLGNDLFDSFDLVYGRGQMPELRSEDDAVVAGIEAAERTGRLRDRALRMLRMAPADSAEGAGGDRDGPSGLRAALSSHSRIYALLRRGWYEARRSRNGPSRRAQDSWDAATAFAAENPDYTQVFDDGRFRTVFTSEYRSFALDTDSARIREGLEVSLRAIRAMHARASADGDRFLVLIIPTKESVFADVWDTPDESFSELVERETRVRGLVTDYLDRHGIDYVSALPALRELLANDVQPYRITHDGHPNVAGHEAIAALVAEHLFQQSEE